MAAGQARHLDGARPQAAVQRVVELVVEQGQRRRRPSSTTAAGIATAEASATRQRSETRDTSAPSWSTKPTPRTVSDQGRLAELAAQVGHVAVDRVGGWPRPRRPTPPPAPLARHDRAGLHRSSASSSDSRRVRARSARRAWRARSRGRASTSAKRACSPGGVAAAQQRAHARDQLLQRERLDQVVVGAGVEPGHAVGDARRGRSA